MGLSPGPRPNASGEIEKSLALTRRTQSMYSGVWYNITSSTGRVAWLDEQRARLLEHAV